MKPKNSYADDRRAAAYAALRFEGTYYLAYRDLPELIGEHVEGRRAIDFGCGTGRSTRFLRRLGFAVTGVDVSREMLAIARTADSDGDYVLVRGDESDALSREAVDLILAAFTFDNVPMPDKPRILRDLAARLQPGGALIVLVSSPEIYLHEWASFSTRDYPENRHARTGDRVRIVITDIEDGRPVEDVVCDDGTYRSLFSDAGLRIAEERRPLGGLDDPCEWVSESRIPPWVIYVLVTENAEARAGRSHGP